MIVRRVVSRRHLMHGGAAALALAALAACSSPPPTTAPAPTQAPAKPAATTAPAAAPTTAPAAPPTAAPAAPTAAPTAAATTVPAAKPATSGERVQIKFAYHVWPGWEDAVKNVIKAYEEKQPRVSVKFELMDYAQLAPTLTPRFAAKDPPDVVHGDSGVPWVEQKLMIDLRDLIKRDNVDLTKLGKTLPNGQLLGDPAQYGLPLYVTGGLIYMNKTLFDKYGVPLFKPGYTMDQFADAVLKLTRDKAGKSPSDSGFDPKSVVHYGANAPVSQLTEPFVTNFGGKYWNDDVTKSELTNADTAAYFRWVNDLACKKQALLTPQPSQQAATDPFVSQRVAISVAGEWQTSLYQKIEDFDWDMASAPAGKSGYPQGHHVYAASNTLGLPKDSKRQDDGWDFLKHFIYDRFAQLQVGRSLGPALIEVAASKDFLDLKKGKRGPTPENAAWAYKEMSEHGSMEFAKGWGRNQTKWSPIWSDFQLSLLTLCDKDVNSLLPEYEKKLTDALNAKA
ncbi:MAG TPA: extracellular solute-binding protein [Chloroflexota bacterium]|nr:extracellular solute-binding protein [Chloroflexota bacterium]